MLVRLSCALFAATSLLAQCDDGPISTREAKHYSQFVFQGMVEAFKGDGANRMVVFHVSRVWKGNVHATFAMPALETSGAFCNAFWSGLLRIGNELIVYASRNPSMGNEIFPIRQKSILVSQATGI